MLEENKRLREVAAAAGPEVADAARQAEQILEQARVQAAGIIRDAETRSPSAGGGMARTAPAGATADIAAISAFLAKERQFLQSLAGLIQGHAESVKQSARSAMTAQPKDTPADPTPAKPAPAKPARAPAPPPPARTAAAPQRAAEPQATEAMQPVRVPEKPVPAPEEPAMAEQPQEGASVGATPSSSPEEDPSLRGLL